MEQAEKDRVIAQKTNEALANRKETAEKRNENLYLKQQVEQLKRMLFGQKRERFEGDPNQQMLPFELEPAKKEEQEKRIEQKIEYTRKRPNHKGRAKLPEHLPVEEVKIYPEIPYRMRSAIERCRYR
ncbi:MAG: transposase [Moheibacter sp.]